MDGTISPSVRDNDLTGVRARQWRSAYREALSPQVLGSALIVIGLYLGAYAAICPLGTIGLPWEQRLAYLALGAALCAPLCHAEYVVGLYLTRFWSPFAIALAVVGTTFVAASTCTAVIYGVDGLFGTYLRSYGFGTVYLFMILSVASCTAVIHYLVSQRVKHGPSGSLETDTAAEPAPDTSAAAVGAGEPQTAETTSKFLERLPAEIGRDIVYLKMSDHYVEVVTTLGRRAVLMRFVDAVAELGHRGLRIHRSYWVAYPHVEGWTRENQRTLLQLTGGHLVPVSRTYLANVRSALMGRRPPAGTTRRKPPEDG